MEKNSMEDEGEDVWVSRADACALCMLRREMMHGADPSEAWLEDFRRRVRQSCVRDGSWTRDHVLVRVSPGILAALRALGACEFSDAAGRPVCLFRTLGRQVAGGFGAVEAARRGFAKFTGTAAPQGGLQQLRASPGFWQRAIGDAAPVAAEQLRSGVLRQLALLQFGEGGREAWLGAETSKLSAEVFLKLERQTSYVVRGRAASHQVVFGEANPVRRLVQLWKDLQERYEVVVQHWLLYGPDAEARAFRQRVQCADVISAATVPRGNRCAQAVEDNARLFAHRLSEYTANALLPPLNGLDPHEKNNEVRDLHSECARLLPDAVAWKIFWLRNEHTGAFRLAQVFLESQNRTVPLDLQSAYLASTSKTTQSQEWTIFTADERKQEEGAGERLVLGLTSADLPALTEDGRRLDDFLTLSIRRLSNVGGLLIENLAHSAVGFTANRLGSLQSERPVSNASLDLEHAAVLRSISLGTSARLRDAEFQNLHPLTKDALAKTRTCKESEKLTAEDKRQLREEANRGIVGLPDMFRTGDFPSLFEKPIIVKSRPRGLAQGPVQAPAQDLAKELEALLVSLSQEAGKLGAHAPLRRSVRLEMRGDKDAERALSYTLDLDDPYAANLVRYLLCQNLVPRSQSAKLLAEGKDSAGKVVVQKATLVHAR